MPRWDWGDFELERKDRLTEALTLPVGVLTVLGSVLGALAQAFEYDDNLSTQIFVVIGVLEVIAFTTCLCYLVRAYHAQEYVYLPTLRELADSKHELLDFFEMIEGTKEDAFADITRSLEARIIEAADSNTANNDRRSFLLYRGRIALFVVLFLTMLAGITFVASQASQARVEMPQELPKPAPARPATAVPQKPAFPQNRVVREGANTNPPKIK